MTIATTEHRHYSIGRRVGQASDLASRCWPAVFASVLVALLYLKAILAADLDWDSLSYHLPFAALRVGLMTHWQLQYGPTDSDTLGAFYKGFPILADLLQGWLWKLTGRPEATNLLGITFLLALAGYVNAAFRVPAAWVVIALLAIPAVQTAVAGSYVDVPAGVAFTIVIFSLCDLWANPERFHRPARWIVLFLAAFAAANLKLQTAIVVCFALVFVIPPVWGLLRNSGWRARVGAALLFLCAAAAVEYNLIRNLLHHGNPLWPIDVRLAGIHFVGPVSQRQWDPYGHTHAYAGWVRWLMSVLEYHALDGRPVPYTNGMGSVPVEGQASGMGGFFGALVVASLCFFVIGVRQNKNRFHTVLLVALLLVTLICACFPNSYALRYDIFWMMFLVIGCLLLLGTPRLDAYFQSYKIILMASLVFVTSVTGGIYFIPHPLSMQQYVDSTGADKILDREVQGGDVICLEGAAGHFDNRFPILFSPMFHSHIATERPYGIRYFFCDGYKTLSGFQ